MKMQRQAQAQHAWGERMEKQASTIRMRKMQINNQHQQEVESRKVKAQNLQPQNS
jgi:hypothetical protein